MAFALGRASRRLRRTAARVRWPLVGVAAALTAVAVLLTWALQKLKYNPVLTGIPVAAQELYTPFAGGLLQLRGERLILHDPKGSSTELARAFNGLSLDVSPRFAVVWDAQRVLAVNTEGATVLDMTLPAEEGRWLSVRLSDQRIGLLKQDLDGALQIQVYANAKLVNTHLFSDKTLLDFGFYGQPSQIWASFLDTEGKTYQTSVSMYKDGSVEGNIAVYGEALLHVVPMEEDVLLVGTAHCMLFDYTGKQLSQVPCQGWLPVGIGGSNPEEPYVLLAPQAKAGTPLSSLWVYNPRNPQADGHITMPAEASLAVAGKKRFFVADGSRIIAYSYDTLASRAVDVGMTVTGILPLENDKQCAVVTRSDVYLTTVA